MDLKERLTQVEEKKLRLSEQLTAAEVGKEDTTERTALLEELGKKQAQTNKLKEELQEYKSCDPQHLTELSTSQCMRERVRIK